MRPRRRSRAGWTIVEGDCIEVMRELPAESFDACLTDPPYGLEFMGKSWDCFRRARNPADFGRENVFGRMSRSAPASGAETPPRAYQSWTTAWASELLRLLRPGAYSFVFGGCRTFHRLACGLEDAGFEVRDCLMWIFGSGFPKSLDVSKAIDRAAGVEREVVGTSTRCVGPSQKVGYQGTPTFRESEDNPGNLVTIPATDAAKRFEGYGTALKPAWEPILLCRKPFTGTVAGNVLEHGTGALNIDACRVGYESEADRLSALPGSMPTASDSIGTFQTRDRSEERPEDFQHSQGRWPANLLLSHHPECVRRGVKKIKTGDKPHPKRGQGFHNCLGREDRPQADKDKVVGYGDADGTETIEAWDCHEDCPVRMLDEQAGEKTSGTISTHHKRNVPRLGKGGIYGDDEGTQPPWEWLGDTGGASRFFYCAKASRAERNLGLPPGQLNRHPTLKPVRLLRYLARLILPAKDALGRTPRLIDPFLGSASSILAAAPLPSLGLGGERDPEYIRVARLRAAATLLSELPLPTLLP